ncbi:MAG TPA: class A beta-lactamase [Steroidobacteraceae bacterium]|jgi:beta-lactamase class A|nr:class A beta-lactamase [Steroidobacteraceae bacterium]
MKRRDFLWSSLGFAAAPSLAADTPITAISDYERDSGGHIGLYAENIKTGAKLSWRADERFVMCSTFKASLAACVLLRVDRGQDDLEQLIHYSAADMQESYAPVAQQNLARGSLSVKEMCRAAVEQSDNVCANLLLARIGGPPALTAFWRSTGDQETRLDDSEPLLNRTPPGRLENTTTPAAMANTLRRLVLGQILSQASRTLFTEWLVGCQTGANRLRAGLPGSWVIGDKTGNNGKDAAGDIAVAWPRPDVPIVMCVYTRGGSPSPQQLDSAFAGIGRFVGTKQIGTS